MQFVCEGMAQLQPTTAYPTNGDHLGALKTGRGLLTYAGCPSHPPTLPLGQEQQADKAEVEVGTMVGVEVAVMVMVIQEGSTEETKRLPSQEST